MAIDIDAVRAAIPKIRGVIPTTSELRLGVVTAFLGVPVFLAHLMRERRLW